VFLDAKIPHIVLTAKDEKSRRGSTLPLHPELVAHLKGWLKQRGKVSPQEKLFFVPNALHRILDRDLKFAGIAKRDSLNRVIDVHALRHTHATLLAQNGVSPV
jgi:integrase